MTYKKAEKILVEACVEAKKKGATIVPMSYGIKAGARRFVYEDRKNRECCPIGAMCVGKVRRKDEFNYLNYAMRVLGVSGTWLGSFVAGFDDAGLAGATDQDGYQAGQRLRQRFLKGA